MSNLTISYLLNRLAKKYRAPGGIKQLAEDLGRPNYNVFKSKLNPLTETHHVYVEELDELVETLDTDEVAHHCARQRGMVCVRVIAEGEISDGDLFGLFLDRGVALGEFDELVRKSLIDSKINKKEYEELMKRFDAVSSVREAIKLRITAIYERGSVK